MAQLKKRGILARVHEDSYLFLFFRLLSAKMGTKIVRVVIFSIYNPYNVLNIKFHMLVKISEF